MSMTPKAFIAGFIRKHEGGLSLHVKDNGNWFDPARYAKGSPQKRNMGKLVGSKFGITAYTLASYRGVKNITAKDMADLKIEEAIDIGVKNYYDRPGFGKLPWDRVVASVMDKGWLSGPTTAILLLQRCIGADQDGGLGPKTVAKYKSELARLGEAGLAEKFCLTRIAYDLVLATNEGPNDPDKAFTNGWNNRSRSFLPGTVWWKAFAA